ncbi:AraC family transcriptional regulator [Baekduia sp. Peel2402]|uniref:AraC family transcriptional regulator n=1 Tax=Baekduia sp. Peel2402 TaxID=3458296 RepID=UPI00403EBD25
MDDALTGLLDLAAVRGVLGARIAAGSDWGWWSAATPGAAFHAVTEGTAWLARPGEAPIELAPGDVLLLPGGAEHALGSDPAAVARTSPQRFDTYSLDDDGTVRIGRDAHAAPRTRILCAHYAHDPSASAPVLALLPEVIHLRAETCGSAALTGTVALLADELAAPLPASALVLGRLVDVLLVQLLRAWLASDEALSGAPSPLRALRDPVVTAAMAEIHAAPGHPWTTSELARATAVSRATLARRFPAVVGETPAGYLTRRRMDLAARRLRDTDDSLEQIAQAVGYTSVYAFSRAFRRARAVPPGRYRTQARAAATAAA